MARRRYILSGIAALFAGCGNIYNNWNESSQKRNGKYKVEIINDSDKRTHFDLVIIVDGDMEHKEGDLGSDEIKQFPEVYEGERFITFALAEEFCSYKVDIKTPLRNGNLQRTSFSIQPIGNIEVV